MVVGDNRPHLYTGMLAAGALGGYAMPVYPDAAPDEVTHAVQRCGVRFVLAEDQEQVDKILDLRERSGRRSSTSSTTTRAVWPPTPTPG